MSNSLDGSNRATKSCSNQNARRKGSRQILWESDTIKQAEKIKKIKISVS